MSFCINLADDVSFETGGRHLIDKLAGTAVRVTDALGAREGIIGASYDDGTFDLIADDDVADRVPLSDRLTISYL